MINYIICHLLTVHPAALYKFHEGRNSICPNTVTVECLVQTSCSIDICCIKEVIKTCASVGAIELEKEGQRTAEFMIWSLDMVGQEREVKGSSKVSSVREGQ